MRLSVLCLCWLALAAPASAVDLTDYQSIAAQAQDDLAANRFDRLEKDAAGFLANPAVTLSGGSRLAAFYDGLERSLPASGSTNTEPIDQLEERLRRWSRAFPRSKPAHVMLAKISLRRAWLARGNGYAATVTPSGWLLFGAQLRVTAARLDAAKKLAVDDPEWHATNLEFLHSASSPEFDAAAVTALDLKTTYGPIWTAVLNNRTPKWGGSWKRYDDTVEDLVSRTKSRLGDAFYALGYGYLSEITTRSEFEKTLFNWPRMKLAFEDLTQRFPGTYHLNNYGAFACRFSDMPTLRIALAKIGDRLDPTPWNRFVEMNSCVFAAGQEQRAAEDAAHYAKPRPVAEERKEQGEISWEASDDLVAGRFEKLEATHAQFLSEKARTGSGAPKLQFFYSGLWPNQLIYVPGARADQPDFDRLDQQIDRWLAAAPGSKPAGVMKARILLARACRAEALDKAANGGKRTPETEALFARAREQLAAIRSTAADDPEWWAASLSAERSAGLGETELNTLAAEALGREPTYPGVLTEILQRAPSQKLKEFDPFVRSVVLPAAPEASELYARSFLWLATYRRYVNLFDVAKPDWALLKRGLDAIVERHPSDWNLNSYANLACLAGDKATAALLLERLQNRIVEDVWVDWRAPAKCRQTS